MSCLPHGWFTRPSPSPRCTRSGRVPRDSGLALFDAFASREKTLHANPGRHAGVPAFELESAERFSPVTSVHAAGDAIG
jgi:hypothetical protein